ncbi:MAG: thiosulfate oxidation carrier protein SoxY [Gallionella sp.]
MKPDIDMERRKALKTGGCLGLLGVLAALGLAPGPAWAKVGHAAFEAKNLNDAFEALGVSAPGSSALVHLTAPDVAANGAVVPVKVESLLPDTEQITVMVDKNPFMLSCSFSIPEGTEGYISTNIRMAQTATVIALVKAGGKFYRASREVQVTVGGCG